MQKLQNNVISAGFCQQKPTKPIRLLRIFFPLFSKFVTKFSANFTNVKTKHLENDMARKRQSKNPSRIFYLLNLISIIS